MNTDIVFIRSWWLSRRLRYNKALLFTGLMGFLVQALIYPFRWEYKTISGLPSNMEISAACFALYLILANIAFTLGSVVDFLFNHEDNSWFREQLFTGGYWIDVVVLVLMIIAFLYIT